MDISAGEAFEVTGGKYSGIFRILLKNPQGYLLGIIQASPSLIKKRGPKPKVIDGGALAPNKNTTQTLMMSHGEFEQLIDQGLVESWEEVITHNHKKHGDLHKEEWDKRVETMKDFLNLVNLEESLRLTGKFSSLIRKTAKITGVAKKEIIKYLNQLILFGFVNEALIPEHYKKGNLGESRTNLSNRKKPGRKTLVYISALINNKSLPPEGPPMNKDFAEKIHDHLVNLPVPHRFMRSIWLDILENNFLVTCRDESGKELASFVSEYEYPTWAQFHYYYITHYDDLGRQILRTTPANRRLNKRAILGNNRWGVWGPGHIYTIDSTIADIYLVHHHRRDLVIGRPIVYVVVDVWSGAVVGFYVCLTGPDWESAKIALFCSAFDPERMAKIRGLKYKPTFRHPPKLPKILYSDRGEALSLLARKTSFQIRMEQGIAAMRRGDWKANVEVKFRTVKDGMLNFIPGAFDARRQEMELNRSDPNAAVMSMREFTEYLYSFFHAFNNRPVAKDKIPDGMQMEDILPTRAAIWDWGHDTHQSTGIHRSDDQLIEELLPKYTATTHKNGIHVATKPVRYYGDIDNERDNRICEDARAGISLELEAWIYPGCTDFIWTSDGCISGLRQIPSLGQNLRYLTEEEFHDQQFIISLNKSKHAHAETEIAVLEVHDQKQIVKTAKIKTKNALSKNPRNSKQNISINRENEVKSMAPTQNIAVASSASNQFKTTKETATGHISPEDYLKRFLLGNK